MSSPQPVRSRRHFVLMAFALAALALVPWLRNHGYLRDLYDYGLVIAANARIDAGERPYRDFGTPIQAGFFAMNFLAEKAGGDTYAALTRGAVFGTFLAAIGLLALLTRRAALPLAAAAVLAVLLGTLSQHTILWHNSVGAVALAVVAWSAALAPTWRGESTALHVITALGLFVGGINKLNFQLVALAAAFGWALLAVVQRRASLGELNRTVTALLFFGFALPIGAELAWTGADPAQWWTNVVSLAAGGRAEYFSALLEPAYYLRPRHDYYGALRFPPIGLAGVALVLATGAVIQRTAPTLRTWPHRILAGVATIAAALGGLLLLATNHEIGYVALACFLILALALWLGFDAPVRGKAAWLALGVPALFIAAVSGEAAWRGQRVLFGHLATDRDRFVTTESLAPMGRYFGTTRLPAALVESLAVLPSRLPTRSDDGTYPVFYGPGCEWLEHVWRSPYRSGQPLWMHNGTSYGPRETAALARMLSGEQYRALWVPVAWDFWPPECEAVLKSHYEAESIGSAFLQYVRIARPWSYRNGVDFNNAFGGNSNARLITTHEHAVAAEKSAEGVAFLGVRSGLGTLNVHVRAHRLRLGAMIQRIDGSAPGPVRAHVEARLLEEPATVLWSHDLQLAEGESTARAEHDVDPSARALQLRVVVAPDSAYRVAAGWRAPFILHALDVDEPPPRVRPYILPDSDSSAGPRAAVLRCDWRPDGVVLRGTRPTPDGLHVAPGGEIWIRSDRHLAEFGGTVSLPADAPPDAKPTVRIVFRKGDRFELLDQFTLSAAQPTRDFRGWFPEGKGWFGVLVDPQTAAVVAQIKRVQPSP